MIDFSKITAIYGGSFDPIHLGHIHVAKSVREKLPEIQQIVFVPAAQSPGKHKVVAPAEMRLNWLTKSVLSEGFKVWGTELKNEGPSFTVNTLREAAGLGARRDRLFLILGADSYQEFPHWKAPEQIRSLCRLVIVSRPKHLIESQNADDILLEISPHPASSSDIRHHLSLGQMPANAIPKAVEEDLLNLSLNSKNPYANQESNGN